MKKCIHCDNLMEDNQAICNKCGIGGFKNKKINYSKLLTLILIIAMIGGFIFSIYYENNKKINNNKNDMLYDAKQYINYAILQHSIDNGTNCFYIYGSDDSIYENAGNYVGSVLVNEDDDKTEIWLSDGKYMINGNKTNLKIYNSKLTATKNCNK